MEAFESGTAAIQRALARLTEEKGVHVTDDDVVIKRATGRSGKFMYVIVALSGIERGVGNVLASVMMRLNSGSIGIWALRQEEVDQLLLNANALSNTDKAAPSGAYAYLVPPLLATVHSGGAVTVRACGALMSGWSKQAHANRASSGSNEVHR